MSKPYLYLIGSLRNPRIPALGQKLRGIGFEVFDDWHAAGPDADDEWKRYEGERGRSYTEALRGKAAEHVFWFDYYHLDRADLAVLALPAGRSAHMEFGYHLGAGKKGYILLDSEDVRWDVMYKFADGVLNSEDELCEALQPYCKSGACEV